MDDLNIREAQASDFDALHNLYAVVDQLHHQALPDLFKPVGEIKKRDSYLESLSADTNTTILVAEVQEQVIGFAHAKVDEINHPVLNSYISGHISDVVVDPKFERRGVGEKLLSTLECWFKEHGAIEVGLTVFCFNEVAISFYRKNGFDNRYCKMVKSIVQN